MNKFILISALQSDFSAFGNKGACWSNEVHIAGSGFSGRTLCGTPMLSQNAWRNGERTFGGEAITEIRCPKCVVAYNHLKDEKESDMTASMMDAAGI